MTLQPADTPTKWAGLRLLGFVLVFCFVLFVCFYFNEDALKPSAAPPPPRPSHLPRQRVPTCFIDDCTWLLHPKQLPTPIGRHRAPNPALGSLRKPRQLQMTSPKSSTPSSSRGSDQIGLSKPWELRLASVKLSVYVGRGNLCIKGPKDPMGSANTPQKTTGVNELQSPNPDFFEPCCGGSAGRDV